MLTILTRSAGRFKTKRNKSVARHSMKSLFCDSLFQRYYQATLYSNSQDQPMWCVCACVCVKKILKRLFDGNKHLQYNFYKTNQRRDKKTGMHQILFQALQCTDKVSIFFYFTEGYKNFSKLLKLYIKIKQKYKFFIFFLFYYFVVVVVVVLLRS